MQNSPETNSKKISAIFNKIIQPPWIILMVCILSYGIMIPWLGLYSDDWILLSTFQKMGADGLTRYFSTNRPIWGWIYQVTMPLLGKTPWHWHLFGLFWHWTAAVSLWWLIRLLWPKQNRLALWTGLLFAVYPGFALQPISITVGHMFLVYTAFLLSACFLLLSQQQSNKAWLFTALALFTSAINLFGMEYFLLLHFLQPVMLWFFFQQKNFNFRQKLLHTLKAWWPYFVLFLGDLLWRTVFFKYQTHNYQYLFLNRLSRGTWPALQTLFKTMLTDWWNTLVVAWVNVYKYPFTIHGYKIDLIYLGISIASIFILFIAMYLVGKRGQEDRKDGREIVQIMLLGGLAMLIGGIPFWLTEIHVGLDGFASRFTLPFIFGAVLIFSALLKVIRIPGWLASAFLAVTIGLSIGFQFQVNNDFRREWITQKDLFWQLAWRIPALEPGTTVFMTPLPESHHLTYATLSAIFDWNFQPKPSPQVMDYAVYYPRELEIKKVVALKPDQNFQFDHLGAVFNGNTSRNITIQFSNKDFLIVGCAHVMSPVIDDNNPFLSSEEKTAAQLSNPDLISAANIRNSTQLIPEIFGKEPPRNRCYYFEKADLAYQVKDWQVAVDLYNEATQKGETNWMDTELVPFIGSFAMLGDWDQALALTKEMSARSYYPLSSLTCELWSRLAKDTQDNQNKQQNLQIINDQYQCGQ